MQDVKAELNFELLEHESIKRAIAGSLLVPMVALCRNWVSKLSEAGYKRSLNFSWEECAKETLEVGVLNEQACI